MGKKTGVTLLGIMVVYISVAFAMKASIGLSPIDAAVSTVSQVLGIKVGTITMLLHTSFFLGQIAIEKRDFRKTECLQMVYITLGGSVLNFFYYTVLGGLNIPFYPLRLAVGVAAFCTTAFGCMMIMETHLMRTPMEGFLQLIADRMGTTLGKLRQKIDIGLVIFCAVLALVFHTEWNLREGTVISALIYGPMMDFWRRAVFSRWKLD